MLMRPFFRHYGGKWLLSGRLPAPQLPTIIEPFAGGAGYSVRYGADREVLLVDTDPQVCALWRWLIEVPPSDLRRLPVDPIHDGADIRDLELTDVERTLIQRWLTPQGSNTNWKMPPTARAWVKQKPGASWSEQIRDRLAVQVDHIRGWRVLEGSYTEAPDVEGEWIIDPPYRGNVHGLSAYGHESLDYNHLAAWSWSRRGRVTVHEQEGAGWLPFAPFVARARTARQEGGRIKRQSEVIWTWDTTLPRPYSSSASQ